MHVPVSEIHRIDHRGSLCEPACCHYLLFQVRYTGAQQGREGPALSRMGAHARATVSQVPLSIITVPQATLHAAAARRRRKPPSHEAPRAAPARLIALSQRSTAATAAGRRSAGSSSARPSAEQRAHKPPLNARCRTQARLCFCRAPRMLVLSALPHHQCVGARAHLCGPACGAHYATAPTQHAIPTRAWSGSHGYPTKSERARAGRAASRRAHARPHPACGKSRR